MLLNYNFHENLINSESTRLLDSYISYTDDHHTPNIDGNFHIISDKIKVPEIKRNLSRKRLTDLLEIFSERFGATLIDGRAGTGKTTIAAEFTKNHQNVSWLRIASTDSDWRTFSRYFLSSLNKSFPKLEKVDFGNLIDESDDEKVQKLIESIFWELERLCVDKSFLIVLDNLHNVFDAKWFEAFFKELLAYNFPNISILLLARTQPPFPIWRLRSKQKLGFIDERLLLFTKSELEEISKMYGFGKDKTERILKKSFGRISKVIELANLQTISYTLRMNS